MPARRRARFAVRPGAGQTLGSVRWSSRWRQITRLCETSIIRGRACSNTSASVAALARQQAHVKKGGQLIGPCRHPLFEGGHHLLDFSFGALALPDLLLQERHRRGQLGGTFGHLLLKPVVEAAQVLGLFLRHLGVVRHLEHLQALIGLLAGDQLLKGLVLLEVGQGLAGVAQLLVDFRELEVGGGLLGAGVDAAGDGGGLLETGACQEETIRGAVGLPQFQEDHDLGHQRRRAA